MRSAVVLAGIQLVLLLSLLAGGCTLPADIDVSRGIGRAPLGLALDDLAGRADLASAMAHSRIDSAEGGPVSLVLTPTSSPQPQPTLSATPVATHTPTQIWRQPPTAAPTAVAPAPMTVAALYKISPSERPGVSEQSTESDVTALAVLPASGQLDAPATAPVVAAVQDFAAPVALPTYTPTEARTSIPLPTPGPSATPKPSPTPTVTPIPPTSTPTSVPAPTRTPAPTAIPPTPAPQVVSAAAMAIDPAEYAVFAEVNRRRVEIGLPELRPAASLFASARAHSLDQAANCFFGHTGSDGSDPGARMRAAGYNWANWGEAVARSKPGDVAGAVSALFNSPPHYDILFTTAFTEGGAGVAYAGDGVPYWTIDVANPRGR